MTIDNHRSPQIDAPATTTRRAVLAAATALPAVAVAPLAFAAENSDGWRNLADQLANLHPNGRAAARRAAEAGFEYADLHSIALTGKGPKEGYPVIVVDAHNGGFHTVTPDHVMRCVWVRR